MTKLKEKQVYEMAGQKVVGVGKSPFSDMYSKIIPCDWFDVIFPSKDKEMMITRHLPIEGIVVEGNEIILNENATMGESYSYSTFHGEDYQEKSKLYNEIINQK